jgi:hypothetical protein
MSPLRSAFLLNRMVGAYLSLTATGGP